MLSAVYAAVVVCLCVCVSFTLRYFIKTAEHRITHTTPHDSPMTSFLMPKIMAKFEQDHPLQGRQMQVGWVRIRHFRRKMRYNSKTLQDRHIVSIKLNRKLYALYQMAMFPMTLVTPNPPNNPNFCIFRRLSYLRSE